ADEACAPPAAAAARAAAAAQARGDDRGLLARRRAAPRAGPVLMIQDAPRDAAQGHRAVDIVRGVAAPTAEWRSVPPGVPCPRGCEYRMDLTTGLNLVRLSAPVDLTGSSGSSLALVRAPDKASAARRITSKASGSGEKAPASRALAKAALAPAPQVSKPSGAVLSAGSSKFKAVHREHAERRVSTLKDGTWKESKKVVKSQALVGRDVAGGGKFGEQITSSRRESFRKLADGRSVVVESITVRKTTVLPSSG
ncbi:unnamed protein product, partial [Prorocentrum cordatum]